MALVDDDQNDGFSFIWTVQNFSHCRQKYKEYIKSPCFSLNPSKYPETYSLTLYPRGDEDNDKVEICFGREEYIRKVLEVEYVLSILTVSGSYRKISKNKVIHFFGNSILYRSSFLRKRFLKKGPDAYFDNETLTIRCRIVKVGDTILESEQCYACTTVTVEKAIYTWSLKSLSELDAKKLEAKQQVNLPEMTSFTVNVFLPEDSLNEDKFEMTIKRTNTNKLHFSTCAISLLDTGKVLHSVQDEHWFEISNGDQIWKISFDPNTSFLTNSKQNSTIYLRCEFVVSCGKEYSRIEKTTYGSTVDRPFLFSNPTRDSDFIASWKDNLRWFHSEGNFSDLTIRTPTKGFPVHKSMLYAQSPVFCTMLESDMKENRTGIVEIEDLEDDTVSMMLLFVYTGSVENLDWEKASKLYFAADKYEMTALKEKCSAFLKENLTASNACKCLILADTHQDEDLKSVAQNLVVENSTDIINSDEWKTLIKEKVHLAAETMQFMLVQNLKV